MKLKIIRKQNSQWGIDGELIINGAKVCDTVENPNCPLPKGKYIIKVLRDRRLQRLVPAIFSLEDLNTNAIIMPGNGPLGRKDGSVIVGERLMEGVVLNTQKIFAKIIDRLDKAYRRGEQMMLEVV